MVLSISPTTDGERKDVDVPSISPFLWYPHSVEGPLALYRLAFPDAIVSDEQSNPHDDGSHAVSYARLTMAGVTLTLFNGGDGVDFRFNESVSLFISCDTAAEVDHLWSTLTEGGTPGRCGWLKDRYGVSWQVVPTLLGQLMGGPDPAASKRVFDAMMTMSKLESDLLQKAYDGQ